MSYEFGNFKPDPALYRKLCEPFPDTETANQSVENFVVELRELREKHKIPDVLIVMQVSVMVSGEELTARLTSYNGNILLEEEMAAFALGEASANRQFRVMKAPRSYIKKPKTEGGK